LRSPPRIAHGFSSRFFGEVQLKVQLGIDSDPAICTDNLFFSASGSRTPSMFLHFYRPESGISITHGVTNV
jgi:hypothetical protein